MQQRSGYGAPSGVRLLELIAEEHGQLFAADEAVDAAGRLGISRSHTYKLLHELARSGFLKRLPTGLYVVANAIVGGVEPHVFAIATHLVWPSAISHWSALHHWGLLEQVPFTVTASTPKAVVTPEMRQKESSEADGRGGHAAWVIDGIRYEFTRIRARDMFGIAQVWVDARSQVPMFDKERAVLDAFVQFRRFGAGGLGRQLLAEHGDELDREKLLGYAEEMARPRVVERVRSALFDRGPAEPSHR